MIEIYCGVDKDAEMSARKIFWPVLKAAPISHDFKAGDAAIIVFASKIAVKFFFEAGFFNLLKPTHMLSGVGAGSFEFLKTVCASHQVKSQLKDLLSEVGLAPVLKSIESSEEIIVVASKDGLSKAIIAEMGSDARVVEVYQVEGCAIPPPTNVKEMLFSQKSVKLICKSGKAVTETMNALKTLFPIGIPSNLIVEAKEASASTAFKNFSFLFLFLLTPVAFAQKPVLDPIFKAQSAYARKDFSNSYKFALESFTKSQNSEGRKLAARSAKELRMYGECLRLMSISGGAAQNAEDAHTVGECATSSQYTPYSISYLTQGQSYPASRDAARFWLAHYYIKKNEFNKAEELLKGVSSLPVRLEERRTELNADIQTAKAQAAAKAAAQLAAQNQRASATPVPLPTPASIPAPQVQKQEVRPAKKAYLAEREKFFTTDNYIGAAYFYRDISGVIIDADNQKYYEDLVVTGKAPSKHDLTLYKTKQSSMSGLVSLVGRLGVKDAKDVKSEFELSLQGGLLASLSRSPNEFFTLGDELPFQALPTGESGLGYSVFLEPKLIQPIHSSLSFLGAYKFNYNQANPQNPFYLSHRLRGEAHWKTEKFSAFAGSAITAYASQNWRYAAFSSTYYANVDLRRWRVFGFGAPSGYYLLRFSQAYPTQATDAALLFSQVEGNFFEYNITPKIFFQDNLGLMFWLRDVIGTQRTFISNEAEALAKKNPTHKALGMPQTAIYESRLQEFRLQIFYDLTQWELRVGAMKQNLKTSYSKSNAEVSRPYAILLNGGNLSTWQIFSQAIVRF